MDPVRTRGEQTERRHVSLNGDTSLRSVVSRKHYIVHFNLMLQENEETLHKRPIMLTFEPKATASGSAPTAV